MPLRLTRVAHLVLPLLRNSNSMAQAPAYAIEQGGDVISIDDWNLTAEAVATTANQFTQPDRS